MLDSTTIPSLEAKHKLRIQQLNKRLQEMTTVLKEIHTILAKIQALAKESSG